MQIREFNEPMTSKKLNESLSQKFGYRINLEHFSDVQLEDARNKLRTRLSQFEMNESFESVLENQTYQKTKLMLDVLNQAILEREMNPEDKAKEKKLKKKYDKSGMKKSMKKQYGGEKGKQIYFATIRKRAMDESVPESWIDSAINRIELGESDRTELKAELKIRYDLNESQASWILLEAEEQRAENIIATKDMIDSITGWIEDVAAMRAEQLLELLDSIRSQQGADIAQRYTDIVKPALDGIYSSLEQTRAQMSQALSVVSGQEVSTMGGSEPAMGGNLGDELGAPPELSAEPGADLGGEMPPAPEGEPGGEMPPAPEQSRAKRESVDYSRKLGLLLNSKKK